MYREIKSGKCKYWPEIKIKLKYVALRSRVRAILSYCRNFPPEYSYKLRLFTVRQILLRVSR